MKYNLYKPFLSTASVAPNLFKKGLAIILFSALLMGCNLEQEIELDLPEYDSRPVVECYLEAGKPFSLLLSQSSPYFDPFRS